MVSSTSSYALNIGLWVAQGLIALGFCSGGFMKLFNPIPKLSATWPWTGDLPVAAVRGLGLVDIAGGVGVVAPALTHIAPGLTTAAALGCVMLQICAIVFHLSRREISALPVNVVFLLLSLFIAWGRGIAIPI